MKKTIIALCMISILIISVGLVMAGKNQNQKQDNVFSLPKNAVEVSPGVFYLGKAMDKGKVVEGYAFMMKDSQNKQAKPIKESSCYTFLAKGAKWKTVEPYIVNHSNTKGLDTAQIITNLDFDINKWEIAAGVNILGNRTDGVVDRINLGSLNYKNEFMFGNIPYSNVIGMTIIWGTFSAPLPFRELVEWDMILDDSDFNWSFSGELSKMDFENIATHELGHAVGMGDLYNSCIEETMYGYAGYGETKKRDLNTGDIAGINVLY